MKDDSTPWYIKIGIVAGVCFWLSGLYVIVHFITKYW